VLVLAVAAPRFVMVVLWIFSDYLSRAYGTWIWPLIGFFVLPTTTLAYAIAQNSMNGLKGGGLVLVAIGVIVDLGLIGGGRGFAKRSRRGRRDRD
jgi:hypothetical protein